MSKINVEEILKKNLHKRIVEEDGQSEKYFETTWLVWWGIMSTDVKNGLKDTFKEIVELVIDKCDENATANTFGGTATKVHKSILQVKQMIDYE